MFIIWVNQRKRKEEIILSQSSLRDFKTRERRIPLLKANNLTGKRILPRKLITLKKADLNG